MIKLIKGIYNELPYKKQIFNLLKNIYIPHEKVYRHLHFKGPFHVNVGANKLILIHFGYELENEIFWKGLINGWEKHTMNLWMKIAKDSKVVFDIGANTGIFSLVTKCISHETEVYAFEPVQRVFDKLSANNKINDYSIHCIPIAVSNSTGKATIYDTLEDHIYSVTVNENRMAKNVKVKEISINTICLDQFIEENNISNIDLIKIDVETHEPQVLEGFKKYLPLMRPTMFIEILNDEVGKKVEEKLEGLNYIFFDIDEEKGIKRVPELRKSPSYNFLICQPEVAESYI